DLLTEIDKYLITYNERKSMGLKILFTQGKLGKEIVSAPEIEGIAIRQFIVIEHVSFPSFLQPYPLHQFHLIVAGIPLKLLPGPMLGLGNITMTLRREIIYIRISSRQ